MSPTISADKKYLIALATLAMSTYSSATVTLTAQAYVQDYRPPFVVLQDSKSESFSSAGLVAVSAGDAYKSTAVAEADVRTTATRNGFMHSTTETNPALTYGHLQNATNTWLQITETLSFVDGAGQQIQSYIPNAATLSFDIKGLKTNFNQGNVWEASSAYLYVRYGGAASVLAFVSDTNDCNAYYVRSPWNNGWTGFSCYSGSDSTVHTLNFSVSPSSGNYDLYVEFHTSAAYGERSEYFVDFSMSALPSGVFLKSSSGQFLAHSSMPAVPESSSLILLCSGLLALASITRSKAFLNSHG